MTSTHDTRRRPVLFDSPAVCLGLVLGALGGWFGHGWLATSTPAGQTVTAAAPVPHATSPAMPFPTAVGDQQEAQPPDERILKLEAARARLISKRNDLLRSNVALDDARRHAEDEKARAEQHATFTDGVFDRFTNHDEIKGPTTWADFYKLWGQNERLVVDFEEKWGGKAPPSGTPEADAYAAEMTAIVNGHAAILKAPGSMKDDTGARLAQGMSLTPPDMAQFAAGIYASALSLDEGQAQQISNVLRPIWAPEFAQAPQEQREAAAQAAYNTVLNSLPPAQSADFARVFPFNIFVSMALRSP